MQPPLNICARPPKKDGSEWQNRRKSVITFCASLAAYVGE